MVVTGTTCVSGFVPGPSKPLIRIDVVFADSPKVRLLWKRYYGLLAKFTPESEEERRHTWLELLSEIAAELGYKDLKQVVEAGVVRAGVQQAHVDADETRKKIESQLLRVLENTEHFLAQGKSVEVAATEHALKAIRDGFAKNANKD